MAVAEIPLQLQRLEIGGGKLLKIPSVIPCAAVSLTMSNPALLRVPGSGAPAFPFRSPMGCLGGEAEKEFSLTQVNERSKNSGP